VTDHPLDAPEVDETSMSQLMAKDPRECTDAQLRQIVETIRAARHLWQQEETSSRSKGAKPNPHKGLGIKDLDIKL